MTENKEKIDSKGVPDLKERKVLLLVLATSRTSSEAIDYALKRAGEGALTLRALYILDTNLSKEVFDRFTDLGFIGDKPSTELSEAVMKEYRQRGYEELGSVQKLAMEAGVSFDTLMETGDYKGTVMGSIDEGVTEEVVLIKRRKRLLKYFAPSFTEEIAAESPVKVTVFTEEE